MRRLINANFPSHGIIGEEFGAERREAEYVWVLDPIDGTKAFICGLPIWGTLIGLTHNGRPVYGMMNQPFSRERFSGDGKAARYEGPAGRRTLRVRACPSVAEAVISTTHPGMMAPAERQRYDRLEIAREAVALRRGLLRLRHAGRRPYRSRRRIRGSTPTTSSPSSRSWKAPVA